LQEVKDFDSVYKI